MQRYSFGTRIAALCALTLRSSGAPTACHQAWAVGAGTFSTAQAWQQAVVARLARTLGVTKHTMPPSIAILGWGSLIWDERPEFDQHHHKWEFDGPLLPIEFARVSKTRAGALTLVLDSGCGAPCTVAYARSKRSDPEDAICDLRSREGTTRKNIGYFHSNGSAQQARDAAILDTIAVWAKLKSFDVVVWTDLQSNFQTETGQPFSLPAALKHLASLPPAGMAQAAAYVRRAPELVVTPLRAELQARPCFNEQ